MKKMSKIIPEDEEGSKQRAALELLVGEKHNGSGDFKANTKDSRFTAILKNKDFALDPTHKEFRKVADGEFIKS